MTFTETTMNFFEAKTFLMELREAALHSGAEGVNQVLQSNGFATQPENWKLLGGSRENVAIIHGQTSHSVGAVNEIIMNAIDALLERKCFEHGIFPDSEFAPQTMKDALQLFYGVNVDTLAQEDPEKLLALSKDIQVVITGNADRPNVASFDRGSGQKFDTFEATFLSLVSGSKSLKRFLQGVFHMGSSAVLPFCKHGYKLIVSCPPIDNPERQVTFSLIRKNEGDGVRRLPYYEYFAPGGQVPYFHFEDNEGIDFGLMDELFTEGTFIQMISYDLPNNLSQDATTYLQKEMQQTLFQLPLPISLVEHRFTKRKPRTSLVVGNHTKLMTSSNLIQEELSFDMNVKPFGLFHIHAYVLKAEVKRGEVIGDRSVVFTKNGQTQYSFPRNFISREVGYKYLMDHLLIHVNCSESHQLESFFQSNRDGLYKTTEVYEVLNTLISNLQQNTRLQQVNDERYNRFATDSTDQETLLKQVVSLVPISKEVEMIMSQAGIKNFTKGKAANRKGTIDQDLQPKVRRRGAIVQLTEGTNERTIRSIPLNGSTQVSFQVDSLFMEDAGIQDVQMDLVRYRKSNTVSNTIDTVVSTRTSTKGSRSIDDLFNTVVHKEKDMARIELVSRQESGLDVDDEVVMQVTLSKGIRSFRSLVKIKITDPEEKALRSFKKAGSQYPEPIKVHRNDASWNELDWTGENIVKVLTKKEQEQEVITHIFVNMDNDIVNKHFKQLKLHEKEMRARKEQYFLNVYSEALFEYPIFRLTHDVHAQKTPDELLAEKMEKKAIFYPTYDSQKLLERNVELA